METVLDRNAVRRGCLLQINERGLYDLTVMEGGTPVETVRNVSLKSAARIAVDKLQQEPANDKPV